jgi:ssDNA-binding Zn-finger/Zn-ribbon topoisomerase 1
MRVTRVCPHCGSRLVIKSSQSGHEFLACPRFPYCKFTTSMNDTETLHEIYAPQYCAKCNHTGLLPFIKDGKVIPHASIDCDCRMDARRFADSAMLQPMDFDFAMSSSFRGASFEYCEEIDPVAREARLVEKPVKIPDDATLTAYKRKLHAIIVLGESELSKLRAQNHEASKKNALKTSGRL